MTVTVQALVDSNPIPRFQPLYAGPHLLDRPTKFMTQNLRLDGERNGPSLNIGVVVRPTAIDVKIGSADTNRTDLYKDLVFLRYRLGNILQNQPLRTFELESFHRPHVNIKTRGSSGTSRPPVAKQVYPET